MVKPLLSLEVATPENKSVNSRCHPHAKKNPPPSQAGFSIIGCSSPFMRLAEQAYRYESRLVRNDVYLGSDNPTRSVPALQGCENLRSQDDGHAMARSMHASPPPTDKHTPTQQRDERGAQRHSTARGAGLPEFPQVPHVIE